jgi:hypothetical protein
MKTNALPFTLLALCGLLTPCVARAGNVVVNGDFEAGNVGFSTGLLNSPNLSEGEGRYAVGLSPHLFHPLAAAFGDHTSGQGAMMIVNSATVADRTVWAQGVNVERNTIYSLSFWIASWGRPQNGPSVDPSPAVLAVVFRGVDVGASFTATAANGAWTRFSVNWDSGNSSYAYIRLVNRNLAAFGNDFAIDDISLEAVPAPTSLVTVMSGVVAASTRRRRSLC